MSWGAPHGSVITGPFSLEPSGNFSGGESPGHCGGEQSINATLSAQALSFTFVEFFQGDVITFTGSRVP